MATLLTRDPLPWLRVWAPCAGPWSLPPIPALPAPGWLPGHPTAGPEPCDGASCGRFQPWLFGTACGCLGEVMAETVCGSREEVRTFSPAHMRSDFMLGK